MALVAVLSGCGRSRPPQATAPETSRGQASPGQPPPAPRISAPALGYAWDGARSVGAFRETFSRVVDAGVMALRHLSFSLDTEASRRGVDWASIEGATSDQRPVQLDMRQLSNTRVEVRAKVGVAGDRGASERLLDEVRAALGAAP